MVSVQINIYVPNHKTPGSPGTQVTLTIKKITPDQKKQLEKYEPIIPNMWTDVTYAELKNLLKGDIRKIEELKCYVLKKEETFYILY